MKGCEDRAIKVMERMIVAGVRPDVVTLTTLIQSYCKDRNSCCDVPSWNDKNNELQRSRQHTHARWIELKYESCDDSSR